MYFLIPLNIINNNNNLLYKILKNNLFLKPINLIFKILKNKIKIKKKMMKKNKNFKIKMNLIIQFL